MRSTAAEGKDKIPGMYVKAFMDGKEDHRRAWRSSITGRYLLLKTSTDTETAKLVVKANHMITPEPCSSGLWKQVSNKNGEPVE